MIHLEDLIGAKGKGQKNMRDIDPGIICDYACEDADITLRLKNIFAPQLQEDNLEKLFFEIEMPLVSVLTEMERTGVSIDSDTISVITSYSIHYTKLYDTASMKCLWCITIFCRSQVLPGQNSGTLILPKLNSESLFSLQKNIIRAIMNQWHLRLLNLPKIIMTVMSRTSYNFV